MNIYSYIEKNSLTLAEKTAIVYEDREVTYGQLGEMVNRAAAGLRKVGITERQKVAILGWNSPEWLFTFYAALKLGAVVVPINPDFVGKEELTYIMEGSEPDALFLDQRLIAMYQEFKGSATKLKAVISLGDEESAGIMTYPQFLEAGELGVGTIHTTKREPAILSYTSGTTGKPKGVICHHAGEIWAASTYARTQGYRAEDRVLLALPLAFVYGFGCVSTACLYTGSTIVMLEKFHPRRVLEAIERHRVTIFPGVPTMFAIILNYKFDREYDLSSLRFCLCSGAALPLSLYQQFKDRFGLKLFDFLGLSEGRPVLGYRVSEETEPKPNSCGRAFWEEGVEAKLINSEGQEVGLGEMGELIFHTPSVCLGYFKDPQATSDLIKDGWCYSGDLLKQDSEGYFYFMERKKDLIKRGGEYISPAEVEGAIYHNESVAEVAVIGVPDPIFGEQLKAFVVPKEGCFLSLEIVQEYCKRFLAEYKAPQYVEIVSSLPKGSTGKILKKVLRERGAQES